MFSVCHANSVLYDLLSTFDLLHDAHQLPRVLGHFVCEAADAVGHVQDGCTDLVGFSLKNSVLERELGDSVSASLWTRILLTVTNVTTLCPWCLPYSLHTQHMSGPD